MSQTVAFLGIGTMGQGMAANLLKAGFAVTVYNRTASRAQPLVDQGARLAATPAEAAKGAQFILSMLADDAASREVWLGANGALAAADKSAVLMESSTVSPQWILELAREAAKHGSKFLDAPVTGSKRNAEAGQLSFLVGGDAAVLEAATPVLKAMSKEIVHLGPIGSGAKLKLINKFLSATQIASLAEGLTWLERSGLDVQKSLDFLKSAAPGSPVVQGISARMAAHNYEVNFLLRLMEKDVTYAQMEASTVGVDLKTAAVTRTLFECAIAEGYGDQDMSAVIEPIRNAK